MRKKKNSKIEHMLIKSILGNSLTAAAWIFELLMNMGILTMEVFLNPNPYADPAFVSFAPEAAKREKKKTRPSEVSIKQSIWRLRKAGFVEKNGERYILTEKGKQLADYVLSRKKTLAEKWDGKYRLVIFDIPEKNKKTRDWLRQELYLLGYKKLQESVLVGKHPLPKDLINGIKRNKIGNFVNYVLAEKIYKNVFNN